MEEMVMKSTNLQKPNRKKPKTFQKK